MTFAKKEVNEKLLKKLAEMQCTDVEIASCLEIDLKTLQRRYAPILPMWREGGKCSLRRAQWLKAMSGDTNMLKHLGKVYLGQRDELVVSTEEPQVRKLLSIWESRNLKKGKTPTPEELEAALPEPPADEGPGPSCDMDEPQQKDPPLIDNTNQ